ncbi:MAG: DMT family transporter [Eubacteriales bacterium]
MDRKKQIEADMMILLVTCAWGVSYVLTDYSLKDMGTMTLNAHRFLIGAAVAAVFGFKRLIKVNKITLLYSLAIGTALNLVYVCVTYGMTRTSIANAGFLCAMTVLFTPLFARVFLKQRQELKVIISVAFSIVGIALLTLDENFSINMNHLAGDILCLGCGAFYSIDLLLTEKAVERKDVNPFNLGILNLAVAGVEFLILSFFIESPHLPTSPMFWGSTLFLAVFCTGLAFVIQPVAQQYTTATHIGVIFTLEPVFNAFAVYFFLQQALSTRAYFGGFIMVVAVLIMELNIKFISPRTKSQDPQRKCQ